MTTEPPPPTVNRMVYHSHDLGAVFKALGHPARRSILDRLRGGERPIGELAAPVEMSLPAVSKHIRVLESAGLLEVRIEGRERLCRLVPEPLRAGEEWISRFRMFWESELNQVERYLSSDEGRGRGSEGPESGESG